jgi:chaperonin GroEL
MNQDTTKVTTFGSDAHKSIRLGIDTMCDAISSTYGPGGRNVLIKKRYVHPILTRDGVTVARDIAGHGNKLKDPIATEAAKLVYQASEKTNKTAGDGTTATVVLLSELYKSGYQRVVSGQDAMLVKKQLDKDRLKVVEFVKSKSIECDKSKLNQVATISSGDDNLGKMISDLVYDIGSDGAVTIEYHNAPHVEVEKVTGYLFGSGFKNLATTVEFEQPIVFVTQKRMAAKADITPILELAQKSQKQFVIIGDVAGAALETLVWAIQNQKADGLIIPPVAYGADGHDYFEDIAIYTGARLWLESDSFSGVTLDDFGSVERSRISRDKAILFGRSSITRIVNESVTTEVKLDDGTIKNIETVRQVPCDISLTEAIQDRIGTIRQQMKGDMTPVLQEVLETRLAKLAGKVSIIKVGAATDVEKEELFFRVEDAVEACKSALSSGVVAGGATTLLFASELDVDPFIRDSLRGLFKLLMNNAAEDGGYRMNQVLNAGYGKGFNLRNMTKEPIDLLKSGIVDATKVVLQTVENSFSVAGALLTTGTVITEEVQDEANKK